MEFHERLKALRKERKMTQAELAKELAYGATAISNYEAGINQPSIVDLKKIASVFDVSMDYLLCVSDIRTTYVTDPEDTTTVDFLRKLTALNGSSKSELLQYMDWLQARQEKADAQYYGEPVQKKSSALRVAQKPDDFKI